MFIFHIATASAWNLAQKEKIYIPENFSVDGFIHCSFQNQVTAVANRFYSGIKQLILLKIDTDLIESQIVEENLEGEGELFPHLYGTLPIEAVIKKAPLQIDATGQYFFPEQLN